MSRFRISPLYCLLLALACSVSLTIITLTPPTTPADWARLNQNGIYIPQEIVYPWPSYALQIALWLLMIGALWVAVNPASIFPMTTNPRPPAPSPLRSEGEQSVFKSPLYAMGRGFRGGDESGQKSLMGCPLVSLPKLLLITITLLGFGLRLYSLNCLPLIVDEIGFAAHASDILHGQQVPIFAPGHNANPSTYSWLVVCAMALFGQNTFAIRLIPLVFGTLSIPAAYLLGRAWWSKRVGLLAAAFLATYPAHVFYSRMSLYDIVDPFFAMLALAWLVQGMKFLISIPSSRSEFPVGKGLRPSPTRNLAARHYFVFSGIAAGMAQYFYHGSRMLPLLMIVYIGVWIVKQFNTERQSDRGIETFTLRFSESLNLCVNSLWFFSAFVIVALPRYAPMLLAKLPITGNMEAMRLPADLADNTLRAALAWIGQPDVSPFWLSDQPLLLLPALLAFLLGLWVCLRQWRDARSIVLLLALPLTTIFGGAIWTAAPLYVRYITALPVMVLLVALGIEKIFFTARTPGENPVGTRYIVSVRPYVGVFLFLVIVLQGAYVSLFVHPQQAYDAITPGHWEEDALAKQAAQLPSDTAAVLLVSPDFGTDSYDGPLQMMSIAHYVAAYGERRAIIVNAHDPARLQRQLTRLGSRPYMTVEITLP